jgi:hypothetical protein
MSWSTYFTECGLAPRQPSHSGYAGERLLLLLKGMILLAISVGYRQPRGSC